MSASAREPHAASRSGRQNIPFAGPPLRTASQPPSLAPMDLGEGTERASASLWETLWTPVSVSSWAGSAGIHAVLLLILALWYFAPPLRRPIHFDSRLAGSPQGDPEGLMLAGGLNTPLPMPAPLEPAFPSQGEALMEFTPLKLEPAGALAPGRRPSGGGGAVNNPGAGEGDGFGLAKFGEGGELIRGVTVKVGDPQFTLIWDSDADLDLHVIEPGGKEIDWEEPRGNQGGELDVDNTKGYGPENIYWLVPSGQPGQAMERGPGPAGLYQWFVVYWGGFGGVPKPTHWKVRTKHAGKVTVASGKFRALNERSRTYTLKVDPPRTSDREP